MFSIPRRLIHTAASVRKWLNGYAGGSVKVRICEESKLATIRLDHIEKRNALSGSMMVQLEEAVSLLESSDSLKLLVIYGAGGTFCSGGDLSFMGAIADPESGYRMSGFMQDVTRRIAQLPLLSASVIDGAALGGGAELSMATDFRLVHKGARLGFVQSRLGIAPGWGGASLLAFRVGYQAALHALLTAKLYNAEELVQFGFCDNIFTSDDDDDDGKVQEAVKFLNSISNGPYLLANRTLKQMAWNGATAATISDAMTKERELFKLVWGGKDHLEVLERLTTKEKSS